MFILMLVSYYCLSESNRSDCFVTSFSEMRDEINKEKQKN